MLAHLALAQNPALSTPHPPLPPLNFSLYLITVRERGLREQERFDQHSRIMITQGSNPSSDTGKAAEIMSRYRPIAPRPEGPANSSSMSTHSSERIEQSPYLRRVWPSLQARPTRTRKRGRTSLPPPPPPIRRTHLFAAAGSMHGFVHRHQLLPSDFTTTSTTLRLLPCPLSSLPVITHQPPPPPPPVEYSWDWEGGDNEGIDLNRPAAADQVIIRIPEEKDLLKQLSQRPIATNNAIVITPQPIRPIGSSVNVKCIIKDLLGCCSRSSAPTNHAPMKRKEVEEEVDLEALPALVSDSNHRVWLANSAYKEMVGQPECSWLDAMPTCKRICGEVVLRFADKRVPVPLDSNGFSCWVTIDWGRNGEKNSVHAFCDVMRLSCESKDYLFAWRFHTGEASRSGSKA